MGAELPRPDARATAAGYTWSHQVGRPGCCLMAQVWAPDGRSVATIEPTDDPAIASHRAEVCALALGGAGAAEPTLDVDVAQSIACNAFVAAGGRLDRWRCASAWVVRAMQLAYARGVAAGVAASPLIAGIRHMHDRHAGERQVYEQLLDKARSVIATIEPESLAEHEQLQQLITGIDAVTDPVARQDLFTGED